MPEAARLPADADRLPQLTLTLDGRVLRARPGEMVATAMLAESSSERRLTFCNMGTCLECMVSVDGAAVRACLTPARDGMSVTSWEER